LNSKSNTNKIIEDWNAGKVPVLAVHPRSAGHGLNMQDGGHHMAVLSPTYTAEAYQQIVARLARSGQKEQVVVYKIKTKETVDFSIEHRLDGRIEDLEDFLEYVKNRIPRFTT
jgi:SNF2 family DNA or RNA helicase